MLKNITFVEFLLKAVWSATALTYVTKNPSMLIYYITIDYVLYSNKKDGMSCTCLPISLLEMHLRSYYMTLLMYYLRAIDNAFVVNLYKLLGLVAILLF